MTLKEHLIEQFGTEEALKIRYVREQNVIYTPADLDAYAKKHGEPMPDVESQFPNGDDAVRCTNYAIQIGIRYPKDTMIFGFANEDNPTCQIVRLGLHPGGHDFAIVGKRYLVDPWTKLVSCTWDEFVYDLMDEAEALLVLKRYGIFLNWKHMTATEELFHHPKLPLDQGMLVTRIDRFLGPENRRISTSLKSHNIETVEHLLMFSEEDIDRIPNLGKKSLEKLRDLLADNGMRIGQLAENREDIDPSCLVTARHYSYEIWNQALFAASWHDPTIASFFHSQWRKIRTWGHLIRMGETAVKARFEAFMLAEGVGRVAEIDTLMETIRHRVSSFGFRFKP